MSGKLRGLRQETIFSVLKERIWKKIQGWKERLLSRAGKEVVIKAVVQAIPTYMMSIFQIPEGLLAEIHSMMAHFWWGSTGENRKVHWHRWANLSKPKNMG